MMLIIALLLALPIALVVTVMWDRHCTKPVTTPSPKTIVINGRLHGWSSRGDIVPYEKEPTCW